MQEYNKIEAIFARDTNGSKKLLDGIFRNTTVEYLKDLQWDMTEKIDGMNISVCWDGYHVEFHGRTERASIPSELVNRLNVLFGGSANEELFEQKFGSMPVILFGEGYGRKIQNGESYIPNGVDFILFDVTIGRSYQSRSKVEELAEVFGIKVVPILFSGTLQQGVDFVKTFPKSTIGDADMEGIVARPTVELKDRLENRIIVKIKAKDFK